MYSGKTNDGLEVKREYCNKLMFTLLAVTPQPQSCGFGFCLEFNENALGRKWPYLVLWVHKRSFQMGWLWGDSDLATPEEIAAQRYA